MSLVKPALNAWLRLTEKTHLSRITKVEDARESFERKSRLFFHAPRSINRAKTRIAGRHALELARKDSQDRGILLYFHGGGYVFGSPETHAAMVSKLCALSRRRAILLDYRKAPENPFPAAVEDAESAYKALLDRGEDPTNIVLGGDSAGGGLAFALLARILEQQLPKPAGLFAFSPLTDLTFRAESIETCAESEVVLPKSRIVEMAEAYAGAENREHPLASPLFAELTDSPPVWLCVGDTEILRDDTLNMANKLRKDDVDVTLHLEHDLPHVWPIFHNILPEARKTLNDLSAWLRLREQEKVEN